MIWFLLLVGGIIVLAARLVLVVLADGHGARPAPRSHADSTDPEGVAPWHA